MRIRTTAHSSGRTADGRAFAYLADREIESTDADHEVLLRSFVAAGTAFEEKSARASTQDDDPPPFVPKAAATRAPGTRA